MITATSSNTIINSTASNPIKMTTVEIIGLPNGANYTLELSDGYVAKLNQTNYTTIFHIPVNTLSLYYSSSSNTISYTPLTTVVIYKKNIYTLDDAVLKHFQSLYTNQTNVIPFYTFSNFSKWNTTITNQIKTFSIANNSQVILGSIKNRIVKYGNLTNGSKIVKANSKIVNTNLVNSAFGFNYLNITNTTVVKANNVFCVNSNLLQNSFCSNETTPVPISVPYYNNVSFQTGKSYYYLNLSYTGKMYQNNSASITINITDKSNSTILYTNTFNSNSLNLNFSYKIPVIDEIEFSIKSSGNSNYTGVNIDPITVPTKINYYLPITFTNYQSSALTANTQLAIGATQSGNIIGFNSLAYKTYENSTLNNIEFFYPNGTLINSWLEGNILNETQNTNLYDSENTLYWVKIGNNAPNFLPADTGTATTNTIYMGFATPDQTQFNNLFNTQTTGEAPQLSNNTEQWSINGGIAGFDGPYSVSIAPNGNYAYVVNHNNSTLSIVNTATNTITGTISKFNQPIGVSIAPNGNYAYVVNHNNSTLSIVNTATNTITGTIIGFNSPYGISIAPNGNYAYVTNYGNSTLSIINTATNTITGTIIGFNQPIGISIAPNGNYAYVANYGNNILSIVNTATNTITGTIIGFNSPYGISIAPNGNYAYVTNLNNNTVSIVNTAINSITGTITKFDGPDGISIAPNGNYAYVANYYNNTISIINKYATYDNGQNIFNYYSNFAGTILSPTLSSTTSGTGTLSVNDGLIANAPSGQNYAYVYTNTAYNPSSYITEALALQYSPRGGFIISSNGDGAGVNLNTWITFTDWQSGVYNSIPNSLKAPVVEGATYQSGNNIAYNNYVNSYSAPATVTNPSNVVWGDYYDTAITTPNIQWIRLRSTTPNNIMPQTTYSSLSSISVSISPTSTTLDSGQSTTLTATVSGGTSPYTYQWYSGTSSTCTSDTTTLGTSSTQTISPTTNTYYCVEVNGQIYSSTVLATVNPALATPTISPSLAKIDKGTYITITSTESGGTTPYSYQWYLGTSPSGTLISGATSNSYYISPTQNSLYYMSITDSATTPETENSLSSNIIVNPILSNLKIKSTNTDKNSSKILVFNTTWLGGTPNYNLKLYSSVNTTCNINSKLLATYPDINSNNLTLQINSSTKPIYYCFSITDSAYSPETNFSNENGLWQYKGAKIYSNETAKTLVIGNNQIINYTIINGSTPFKLKFSLYDNGNSLVYNYTKSIINNNQINGSFSYLQNFSYGIGVFNYNIQLLYSGENTSNITTSSNYLVIGYPSTGKSGGSSATNINSTQQTINITEITGNNTQQIITEKYLNISGDLFTKECSLLNYTTNPLLQKLLPDIYNEDYLHSFINNCYISYFNIKNNKLSVIPIWIIIISILIILEIFLYIKDSEINITIIQIILILLFIWLLIFVNII